MNTSEKIILTTMSNLDFAFEGLPNYWSDTHVETLRIEWAKMKPEHKLYEFNREFHTEALLRKTIDELEFIANANIPHMSEWASEVLEAHHNLTIKEK